MDTLLHDQKVDACSTISRNGVSEDETVRGYLQQDGATIHTARVSVTLLLGVFVDRVISKNIWPQPSTDLTPT
jgi:hypothetical protein